MDYSSKKDLIVLVGSTRDSSIDPYASASSTNMIFAVFDLLTDKLLYSKYVNATNKNMKTVKFSNDGLHFVGTNDNYIVIVESLTGIPKPLIDRGPVSQNTG